MISYPDIDPIAFRLGPIKVHWYGIMYLLGFGAGWRLGAPPRRPARLDLEADRCRRSRLLRHARRHPRRPHRLCAVLRPQLLDARTRGIRSRSGKAACPSMAASSACRRPARYSRGAAAAASRDVFDFTAPLPGSGSSSGASATSSTGSCGASRRRCPGASSSTAVVRHPSQLYEALLEGIVLFTIMWWFTSKPRPRLAPSGLFLRALRHRPASWWSSCACRTHRSATSPAAGSPWGRCCRCR